MNVLFCYKWERDPNEATITSEGVLKWFDTKLKTTDDEATAIAMARKLAQDSGGTLTGVTIGDGDVYWALARGAERAVSADALLPDADNALTAARLAEAINAVGGYDVIIMGDVREYSGVAPAVAAKLGLPMVVCAQEIAADAENADCVLVTRTTGEAQETLRVHTPALISIVAVGSEQTRPTMRQVMAAKKLPVERLGITADTHTNVNVLDTRLPQKRRAQLFEGEAKDAVDALLAVLREKEIL